MTGCDDVTREPSARSDVWVYFRPFTPFTHLGRPLSPLMSFRGAVDDSEIPRIFASVSLFGLVDVPVPDEAPYPGLKGGDSPMFGPKTAEEAFGTYVLLRDNSPRGRLAYDRQRTQHSVRLDNPASGPRRTPATEKARQS